jgi:hypothetical protein
VLSQADTEVAVSRHISSIGAEHPVTIKHLIAVVSLDCKIIVLVTELPQPISGKHP